MSFFVNFCLYLFFISVICVFHQESCAWPLVTVESMVVLTGLGSSGFHSYLAPKNEVCVPNTEISQFGPLRLWVRCRKDKNDLSFQFSSSEQGCGTYLFSSWTILLIFDELIFYYSCWCGKENGEGRQSLKEPFHLSNTKCSLHG